MTAEGLVTVTGSATAGVVIPGAAGFHATASLLLGIARATVASGSYGYVDLIEDHLIEAGFTGSSKTTIAATDALAQFDLSTDLLLNLDDTTNGVFCPIGGSAGAGFDNTNRTVRGKFLRTSRYI